MKVRIALHVNANVVLHFDISEAIIKAINVFNEMKDALMNMRGRV